MALGAAMNVGSKLNDAYTFINAGLPHQVYEAVGAAIFFIAVALLLFRWDKERETSPTPPSKGRTYTSAELNEIANRKPVTGLDVVKRLEKLEGERSKPAETAVQTQGEQKSKNNKPYNAQDIDRLQDILFELRQFINGDPRQLEAELKSLRVLWYTQVVQDGSVAYFNRLRKAAAKTENLSNTLNDLIYKKHSHYKDEVRTALCLDEEWFPRNATGHLITFASKIDALPEKPELKTVRVLEESWGQYLDMTGVQFERWIPQVNDRIDAMSGNLRKSGVTGFEK